MDNKTLKHADEKRVCRCGGKTVSQSERRDESYGQ